MRLVLDTNVALSAVLGESAPRRLIELGSEGEIALFSSAELLAEVLGFGALQSADAKLGRAVSPTVQSLADWRRKRKAGVAFEPGPRSLRTTRPSSPT